MQQREILRMGCRLVGIYCLVLAIPELARALWLPSLQGVWERLPPVDAFLGRVAALVGPALTAVVGAHLLLGGSLVQRLAFRENVQPSAEDSEGLFVVLMRLLGVYFVARDLPALLGALARLVEHLPLNRFNHLAGEASQPVIGWETVPNLLPTTVELVFGFYLLMGGSLFRRLAFSPTDAVADTDGTGPSGSSDR